MKTPSQPSDNTRSIEPVRARYDYERGHWVWGLAEDDFNRIQAGYACGRCLEKFETRVKRCPVCKEPNMGVVLVETPEWRH